MAKTRAGVFIVPYWAVAKSASISGLTRWISKTAAAVKAPSTAMIGMCEKTNLAAGTNSSPVRPRAAATHNVVKAIDRAPPTAPQTAVAGESAATPRRQR